MQGLYCPVPSQAGSPSATAYRHARASARSVLFPQGLFYLAEGRAFGETRVQSRSCAAIDTSMTESPSEDDCATFHSAGHR